MNCSKHKAVKGILFKEVLGERFETAGLVCSKCDSQLWSAEVQKSFNLWLGQRLKSESFRGRMKIQKFNLTKVSDSYLQHLEERFLVQRSRVITALISIYLYKASIDPQISKQIDEIDFTVKKTIPVSSVRLSPQLYMKFTSMAKLLDMNLGECAEEIVNRMATFLSKEDKVYSSELELVLAA